MRTNLLANSASLRSVAATLIDKSMRFIGFLSFITVIGAAFGADDVVEMPPVHAMLSDVYFTIRWERATDTVAEIRIKKVKTGSQAEKLGLKVGDLLTATNGVPVVGRKRADIVDQNHDVILRHTVTFTGHRGFFRKDWSITIDSALLMRKEPNNSLQQSPQSRGG